MMQNTPTYLDWSTVLNYSQQGNPHPLHSVRKSDAEWRKQLTEEQYYVTRQHGTERPFSSDMCSRFDTGLYTCVCCNAALFNTQQQFKSGTGWPSFDNPVHPQALAYYADHSHEMTRIEVRCNCCDAHLGHVFPDGPTHSTGLRFCINAVALVKQPA